MFGRALVRGVPKTGRWLPGKGFQVQLNGGFGEAVDATPLAPVDRPPAIYCLGLNYKQHAEETNLPIPKFPVIFLKSPNSILDPGGKIEIPPCAQNEVDYEGEIAFIVKAECKNVSIEDADGFIEGYTLAQDITARRWQGKKGGNQWCMSKSYDTFCPLGPVVIPTLSKDMVLRTFINGEQRQCASVSDMIFTPQEILSFLTQNRTIPKGSVVLTGTPSGVGFLLSPPQYLKPNDQIVTEVEGIGRLVNTVS
eukprot:GEMP01056875.1.p1 GENE.GEMP01056875.1~~GEMP01056875.1.p1  ORF type:complete len:252 (+),score=47.42 GEMP01056875.1:116-871(+)